MGSNDGVHFELIENLTKAKNGMLMSTSPYTSPVMGNNSKPYRYIRYSVNHTNTGSVFSVCQNLNCLRLMQALSILKLISKERRMQTLK